ncbi:hypothetical protein HSBAA_PA_0800 (plasmid) [Vreelandella sulfidaeris]|uniref:Integrase catalytic domain-containing protein n=1 Tax=Vreelandella sulfidaeris TaxID=115553 RepID=A0A455UI93_9GAMM|nr:hypothetical protein HSBAA_PA_0800 [Halomonas sulfidaeris]
MPTERVIRALDQIIEWRGKPHSIRCDNGPEYISGKLSAWAEGQGIQLMFIQPGKPQQNAYIERYNRTVRYDWLAQYLFESTEEVQDYATRWLWHYNHERLIWGLEGSPSTETGRCGLNSTLKPSENGDYQMSKALRITWATSVFSSCLVKGAFMRSSGSRKPAIRQAVAK